MWIQQVRFYLNPDAQLKRRRSKQSIAMCIATHLVIISFSSLCVAASASPLSNGFLDTTPDSPAHTKPLHGQQFKIEKSIKDIEYQLLTDGTKVVSATEKTITESNATDVPNNPLLTGIELKQTRDAIAPLPSYWQRFSKRN